MGRMTILRTLLLTGVAVLIPATLEAKTPVIVDTDVGSDDLIAIAFLLARPDVRIEAVTVANGLAHVEPGAMNVLKLLDLAGKNEIPVYAGRAAPMQGAAAFPDEWRRISDELPGVQLPATARRPAPRSAADFLAQRLADPRRKVRILALGPLTNLGEALARAPQSAQAIEEIVIMGGAVHVPGNLGDGGYFKTDNRTAEWNFFVDPQAAQTVFASGVRIMLVPLDATNKVPIDVRFLRRFQSGARTPLGRFVAQVLETDRKYIEENIYYAWDPLAAVALVNPGVVRRRAYALDIQQQPPARGRTRPVSGRRPNARVAYEADAAAFKRVFLKPFITP